MNVIPEMAPRHSQSESHPLVRHTELVITQRMNWFCSLYQGYQTRILQWLLVPQRAGWACCTHQAPLGHTLLSICPSGDHLSILVLGLASTESADPTIPLGTLCHQPLCDDMGLTETNIVSASEEPPYRQPAMCLQHETQTYQKWVNSKPVSTFIILPSVSRTETPVKTVFFQILLCLSDMPQFKVYSLENKDMVSNTRAITENNLGLSHTVTFLVLLIPYHLVLLLYYHLCFPPSLWLPFGHIPQPSVQVSSLPITHFLYPPVKLPYPHENE